MSAVEKIQTIRTLTEQQIAAATRGERQTRAQSLGAVGLLDIFAAEDLAGFVVAVQLHQEVGGVEAGTFVLGFFPAGSDQHGQCLVELARRRQGGGFVAQGSLGRGHQAIDEGAQFAFRQGAVEFIDQLATEQHLYRRNAAHAKVLGEFGVLVGIDLGQEETTAVFVGELFQHRLQDLAGFAPRRPEIDEHGRFGGRLEDLGFEIFDGNVKGVGGHGGFPEGCG